MFGVQNYRKSNKLRTITSNYIKYLTKINTALQNKTIHQTILVCRELECFLAVRAISYLYIDGSLHPSAPLYPKFETSFFYSPIDTAILSFF